MPSLLTGLVGGLWLWLRPLELDAQAGALAVVASGLCGALALLGAAWALERLLPSFRAASRLLEGALRRFPMSVPLALALAAATSLSEELFFRGALLPLIGVWGQAAVFALVHPAPRRAWSYTAFTFVAGLLFGYLTLWTGSLWAAILAHFLVNATGFLEVRRLQARARRRAPLG